MEPLSILALESTPKIGPKTIEKVISLCPTFQPSDPSDMIEILKKTRDKFGKLFVPDIQTATVSLNKAKEIMQLSREHNIQLITRENVNYPKLLLKISDSPILLHILGNHEALNRDCIAIIGTREPTQFGINKARELAAIFSEKGFTVVSGLADGIDSAAHQGALDSGGTTVAVLAHGLDRVYPAKNKELAKEIVEHNGALVSEYPWGRKIIRNYFIARDRIQSGLSLGALVVETGIEGGTMNTVRFCKDQERTLIVLKHPREFDRIPKMLGNDQLISKNQADIILEGNNYDINLIVNKLIFRKNKMLNNQLKKKIPHFQMRFD